MTERKERDRESDRKKMRERVKKKETTHHPSVSRRAVVSMVEKERGRKRQKENGVKERE